MPAETKQSIIQWLADDADRMKALNIAASCHLPGVSVDIQKNLQLAFRFKNPTL